MGVRWVGVGVRGWSGCEGVEWVWVGGGSGCGCGCEGWSGCGLRRWVGVGVRGWSGCKGKKCAWFVRFVNYLSNVTALYMTQGHTSLVPRPAPFSVA